MLKKSVVIRANRLKKPVIKTDYKSIIFFTLLLCGIVFGVMLSQRGSPGWHSFFSTLINNHLNARLCNGIWVNFCGVFVWFLLILFFDYIMGLCGIGTPFLHLTPVLFGIYCGVSVSQFYNAYLLSGIGYCAIVNIPSYAIAAATLIKCCCYSTEVSKDILYFLVSSKSDGKNNILKDYSMKYCVMLVPMALGALLNAVCFRLFGDLFGFIQ